MTALHNTAANTSPLVPVLLHEIRRALPDDTAPEVHDLLGDALNEMLGKPRDGGWDGTELRQAVEGMLIDGCHDIAQEFAGAVADRAKQLGEEE